MYDMYVLFRQEQIFIKIMEMVNLRAVGLNSLEKQDWVKFGKFDKTC